MKFSKFLPKPPFGATLRRSDPLARDLAVAYLFNEMAGGKLYDVINRRAASLVGTGAAWGSSIYGGSQIFSGVSGTYFTINDDAGLDLTVNTSVEFLINIQAFPNAGNAYLGNIYGDEASDSASTACWRIGSRGDSALAKRVGLNYHDGNNNDAQNNTDLSLNTWINVIVTTDGANARWYLDGQLDTAAAYVITPGNQPNNWLIGGRVSDRPFNGTIAHLARWNRTLSDAEVIERVKYPYAMFDHPLQKRVFKIGAVPVTNAISAVLVTYGAKGSVAVRQTRGSVTAEQDRP